MSEGFLYWYNSQRATLTVDVEDSKCYNLLMKNKIIFVVIVLIILAGFGFYLSKNKIPPSKDSPWDESSQSSKTVNIGGISIEGDGDIKIEPIEIKITISRQSMFLCRI